eukprot:6211988-Pleurochrysis_carterae.AAC.1
MHGDELGIDSEFVVVTKELWESNLEERRPGGRRQLAGRTGHWARLLHLLRRREGVVHRRGCFRGVEQRHQDDRQGKR